MHPVTKKISKEAVKASGLLKLIGYVSIALLALNLVLFSFRVYDLLWFWIILISTSVVAFGSMYFIKK